ncbi:VOC family protein [Fimbriimonas ginsengisoli]|uniref:Glyoxalase-like domain-containing protein n=1 Tax=Fimbriimonas ginsengisoli Gsoil 348 TaxID=661478 RepID=A0A068NKP9_FIMGI|nr:VOC family protein [Fimbriimonas ginsengisoli]AIE83370.1 hypothetical protein OP10G_0002 [Fimbriimonas ginsengisoli Gsoil 348]
MRLSNVVIAARNFEAMSEFYRTLTDWPTFFENDKCIFLGRGKPYLVLHRLGPETEVDPPERTLCLDLEVLDVDVEVERLARSGLACEMRGEVAVLRDPVGNLIELVAAG